MTLAADILTFLANNQDRIVSIQEVMKGVGSDRPSSVSAAITTLIARGAQVERPTKGVYVYRGMGEPPKVSSRIFEELATSKSGRVVVQDENGVLYILTEFE